MARPSRNRKDIEVIRYTPYKGKSKNLVGFCVIRVGDVVISGITHTTNGKRDFINMPQEKGGDGEYYSSVWIDKGSKEENLKMYESIADTVFDYLCDENN